MLNFNGWFAHSFKFKLLTRVWGEYLSVSNAEAKRYYQLLSRAIAGQLYIKLGIAFLADEDQAQRSARTFITRFLWRHPRRGSDVSIRCRGVGVRAGRRTGKQRWVDIPGNSAHRGYGNMENDPRGDQEHLVSFFYWLFFPVSKLTRSFKWGRVAPFTECG